MLSVAADGAQNSDARVHGDRFFRDSVELGSGRANRRWMAHWRRWVLSHFGSLF